MKKTIAIGSALLLGGVALEGATRMRVAVPVPKWWRQIGHLWTSRAWETGAPDWGRPLVWNGAQRTGVPAALIAAVIHVESRWRPNAVSSAGAIGLMQLMPGTAEEQRVDPWDATANVDGGARYLRAMLDQFDDAELGIAAYNAGPERIAATGGLPAIEETRSYVASVMSRLAKGCL